MRKETSRFAHLILFVAILGLLSTGCKAPNWASLSNLPGASWFSSKPKTSEYQVPDRPSVGYASLPVDQAANYNEQATTEPTSPLPVDNPAPTDQGTAQSGYQIPQSQPNYPTTNQGSAQYLTPPNTSESFTPVNPYQNTAPAAQPGTYDASGLDSQYQPIQQNQPPATTVTTGGEGEYQQGFYKPSQGGQFPIQSTPVDPLPIDSNLTPVNAAPPLSSDPIYNSGTPTAAQPPISLPTASTPTPIYTGQLPSQSRTQLDGTTTAPLTLPPVPAPGTYRPGSTNTGQ